MSDHAGRQPSVGASRPSFRLLGVLGMSVAVLLLVGTAVAQGGAARQPGSVGIFPVHRSGAPVSGGASFFTVLSLTNTDTQPATPLGFGGSTNVHFQYVNVIPDPADPFVPLGCTIFDRIEFLTPADTLSVLTRCHDATAGGQEG